MDKILVKNLAFFDAEYTANSDKDRGVQEMIQCALLIYQVEVNDNVIVAMMDKPTLVYTTFVKPRYNKILSDYIKDLTGITQGDVDRGKDFCDVMENINDIIKKYNVDKILTWGPDKQVIKNNCSVINCDLFNARCVYSKFNDVSREMSDMCGYSNVVSQHKLCKQFGITEVGERHDAYSDARNLAKIIKEFCGQYSL